MQLFSRLLEESVIVQGIITLVVISTTAYLYATGRDVSDGLLNMGYIIIGYYFGSKSQQVMTQQLRKLSKKDETEPVGHD